MIKLHIDTKFNHANNGGSFRGQPKGERHPWPKDFSRYYKVTHQDKAIKSAGDPLHSG